MQNTSNVLADIEAIIARAMEEVGVNPTSVESPATNNTPADFEVVEPVENPIIPERITSVVVNEATSRFSGAVWYEEIQKQKVILAGLGGIGSYIAFLLGRLKIDTLVLYDDDRVETANMSGQLYGRNEVGQYKVHAISNLLYNYTELVQIVELNEKFTAASQNGPVMICGFDNMAARKTFFSRWLDFVKEVPEEDKSACLFIDGRLAAEEFQVLCVRGDDAYSIDKYQKNFLFRDSEADETICSYKQTTFMANMIASVIVNLFVNFAANRCNPLIPRDLPFFTEYSAETMFFKVIA